MIKKIVLYILYICVILTFLLGISWITEIAEKYAAMKFDALPKLYVMIGSSIIFGCLIGLPQLLQEIRKKGKWKVDLYKVIIVGLPLLFSSLSIYIYYLASTIKLPLILLRFMMDTNMQQFAGILFGHVLITSIYKALI